MIRVFALLAAAVLLAAPAARAADGPCAVAILHGARCEAANEKARDLLNARGLAGAVVIRDVRTGAVLVSAERGGANARFDANTPVLPLSVMKLYLAAEAWEHSTAPDQRLTDLVAEGVDSEGRAIAVDLDAKVPRSAVVSDLARMGLSSCGAAPCTWLSASVSDKRWADAFSLGEADVATTVDDLSAFVRVIGDDGVGSDRVLSAATAHKLQAAMRATVTRGSARRVDGRVRGGWTLGGKTGTGPATQHPYDGVFAGLAFDPRGVPRYAFAIYLAHGGPGAEAPAETVSDLLNFALGL
jgi:hypothetical protein